MEDPEEVLPEEPAVSLPERFLRRCCQLFYQLSLSEISGSVGDLGTFIPLVIALSRQDAIALTPVLFWAGFANVVTGFVWDVPMCVQPMKSIAAVAISQDLTQTQVSAAGVWMGIFLVLLSVTNGIEVVNWLVPTPVVSGIQMGVGIGLAIRGINLVQDLPWWDNGLDCILVAIVVALLCLYWLREPNTTTSNNQVHEEDADTELPRRRSQQPTKPPVPVGIYLCAIGIIVAIINLFQKDNENDEKLLKSHVVTFPLQNATWDDWKQGLLEGAIPQLPLTTLNSVVSVCCLAHTLYPEKRRSQRHATSSMSSDAVVSRKEVSWGVGLMNLLLCPLGAMPSCHGAGGLAGQHKFGARHGASVVFLGLNKMLFATLLGGSLLKALDALPNSILGLMLTACGHELALMGWSVLVQSTHNDEGNATSNGIPLRMKKGAVVALVTVIVYLGLHKTHYAAFSGWVSYMIYGDGVQDYWAEVSLWWVLAS
jgi:Molybdate transporter of MFS superfamily